MDVRQARYDGEKDLARASAFDVLVGNTDRHSGNWMLGKGKISLIDNGLAFPTSNKGFRSWLFSEARVKDLSIPKEVISWDAAKVGAAMDKHGLGGKEKQMALNRLESLKLAAEQGHTFRQYAQHNDFVQGAGE
jgi:hypothetical protein